LHKEEEAMSEDELKTAIDLELAALQRGTHINLQVSKGHREQVVNTIMVLVKEYAKGQKK
jgi:hypothetical protein